MVSRQIISLLGVVVAVAPVACGGEASSNTSIPDSPTTLVSTLPVAEGATTSTSVSSIPATIPPTTVDTTVPSLGSRDQPLAVGQVAEVGDWRIRVAGVTPDAVEAVLAENQFNDPPAEGRTFFMADLEATYVGEGSSNFWIDVSLKPVGPSNVAYEAFEDGCGVIPDAIDNAGETFTGGSIVGTVCWSVTEDDAAQLVLVAEESFSFQGKRAFLSLDPDATPVEGSTAEGADRAGFLAEATPVGEPAGVGPWTLTVVEVLGDSTSEILSENQFNAAPDDGELFYMARVEATYRGEESSTFWIDMSLKAVGDGNVAYEGFEGSCGVIPDPIDEAGETFPGGSISGNVCWKVKATDVGSLVMIAEESFSFDEERVFFSLTSG